MIFQLEAYIKCTTWLRHHDLAHGLVSTNVASWGRSVRYFIAKPRRFRSGSEMSPIRTALSGMHGETAIVTNMGESVKYL